MKVDFFKALIKVLLMRFIFGLKRVHDGVVTFLFEAYSIPVRVHNVKLY